MFKRYKSDSSGNIAIITGLTLGLMVMGTGIAVDYSGSTREHARLQTALDTAVLAAAAADENLKKKEVEAIVENVLRENFAATNVRDAESLKVKSRVTKTYVSAKVDMSYSTSIMSMFGKASLPITIESGGPRGMMPKLDIALVVDTTDSMAGGNMADLQAAADDLLKTLRKSGAEVRVALVPYGQYVNVGMGAENAPWVDAAKTWEHEEPRWHTYDEMAGGTPPVCLSWGEPTPTFKSVDGLLVRTGETPNCAQWQSGTPAQATGQTVTTPIRGYDRQFAFNGCMGSRQSPDDIRPDASASNPIPAAMDLTLQRNLEPDGAVGDWYAVPDSDFRATECGQRITPLTDDLKMVASRVDALTTDGQTYLPAGLIWGWRVLDPRAPYAQAASRPDAQRVMIFMTDGENSTIKLNEYHKPIGGGTDIDYMASRAAKGLETSRQICWGAKGDGIEIYTLAYNLNGGMLGGETARTLRQCASSSRHSYTPDTQDELVEAFRAIVASLAVVRLDY